MPLLGVMAAYCCIKHLNPLDNNYFLLAAVSCFPMLWVKSEELLAKTNDSLAEEFRSLPLSRLYEIEQEIKLAPPGMNKALIREALQQVISEKRNKG